MTFQNLPLHALIVHMPIALTVLVPLLMLVALVAGSRWMKPHQAWFLPVGGLALLLMSGLVAEKTGEEEEDRVEKIVPEGAIHTHEEAAELFVLVTGGVLVVAAGGLLPNRIGSAMRVAGAIGTLGVLGAGWNVGHSGGKLVYEHNAGAAYTAAAAPTAGAGDRE
ncbi:MAG: hypothetical protein ACK50C_04165 [Gemmatimonadaceae bacterium]